MKPTFLSQLPKSALTVVLVSMVAVLSFALFTATIGGDALGGRIENGRYYVRGGAKYVEVSLWVYVVSASLSLFASVGLLLIGNRVLRVLNDLGIMRSRRGLQLALNVLFAIVLGVIALCAVVTLVRAIGVAL